MTDGEKLLLSVVKRGDLKVLSQINRRWLDGSEVVQHRFILDYYKESGEFIGVKAYCDKFDVDISSVDARPAYYLQQVRKRFIFARISEEVPKVVRGLKADPLEKLQDLRELVSSLTNDGMETKDSLYSDDTDKRKRMYEDRVRTKGVTYLSMGEPDLDSTLYGYRETDLITIGGRAGLGKCLGKGTPILMADLSVKNVEDIVVGDKLMGPDGTPRTVLSLARGREQMYWVRQVKGMDYRVNKSHILSLAVPKVYSRRRTVDGKRVYLGRETSWVTENVSITEYYRRSAKFRKEAKGYKAPRMTFSESEVPFDPYFLGVWLGDGTSRELTVTSYDLPIIRFLHKYSISMGGYLQNVDTGLYRFKNCKTLARKMRELNLLKTRGSSNPGFKHIPKEFIFTSVENRLRLLAGLVDTDGYTTDNCIEITQKSDTLADDIMLLCRTLGFYVSHNLKYVDGTPYHRMVIQGDGVEDIPVRITRKKCTPRKQVKNVLHTGIVVEKDVVDDYYGFTIDGDHLFCLADFTVTHNTWLIVHLARKLNEVVLKLRSEGMSVGDILFVSNEIGEDELKERFDCINFRLPYERFQKGELTEREKSRYYHGLDELKDAPSALRIIYSCETIDELTTNIGLYNPCVIFVDGSYLMEPSIPEGWEKITHITRNLKRLSKNNKVPIINTTQLRRGTGKGGSRDALSGQDDFAYSGSYVQDSDIAIRMFQDADMKFYDQIGCEIVKGRRVSPGTLFLFQNNLEKMDVSVKLSPKDAETEPTSTRPEVF